MATNSSKLMSIGEVAKTLGVTRKIILNYEAKGLLVPDKKEGASGNRYYTADSISMVRTIRILQNLGLSLDEVYEYYYGDTDLHPMIQRLEKLRDELSLSIEKLKERAKNSNDFEIRNITIPAQTIYKQTITTTSIQDKTVILRETFMKAIKTYGSDTSKRMFFIEYPIEDQDRTSYCIAIPPTSEGENVIHLPEEKALCLFYHGSYENIPVIRDQMMIYAKNNGYKLKGTCRHTYLEGPPQHTDPSKFITQIAIIIE